MCNAHICQCATHIFAKIELMEFGKFFKECRKQAGLTQMEVANKLHIQQSNISDWEKNISRPCYEYLIELAKIYDVTLYELLGLDEATFR